ncbi:MAG: hypothetical protein KJ941_09355 [Bacteroidetes bacterium]|nr:hypothetical protein [Bacteroidota bacterium]
MTSSLSLLLKKYSVPALFTILGITMVVVGLKTKQNGQYIIATIMMLIAGLLSFLYSSGKVSSKVLTTLGIAAGIGSLIAMGMATMSVYKTDQHIKKFNLCEKIAISNLRDIRTAQKAYAEANGKYASTWEELNDFIKNGKVPFVLAVGVLPSRKITEAERNYIYKDNRAIDNNMTEMEAYLLSKSPSPAEDLLGYKRDTIMVSFMSTKFGSKSYMENRMKEGIGKFYADSITSIPMSGGKKWKLETKDSIQIGLDFFPAIRVSGKLPIAKIEGEKPLEMSFGKLTSNDVSGSWEQN